MPRPRRVELLAQFTDRFSAPARRAAASAKELQDQLTSLSGSRQIDLTRGQQQLTRFQQALKNTARSLEGTELGADLDRIRQKAEALSDQPITTNETLRTLRTLRRELRDLAADANQGDVANTKLAQQLRDLALQSERTARFTKLLNQTRTEADRAAERAYQSEKARQAADLSEGVRNEIKAAKEKQLAEERLVREKEQAEERKQQALLETAALEQRLAAEREARALREARLARQQQLAGFSRFSAVGRSIVAGQIANVGSNVSAFSQLAAGTALQGRADRLVSQYNRLSDLEPDSRAARQSVQRLRNDVAKLIRQFHEAGQMNTRMGQSLRSLAMSLGVARRGVQDLGQSMTGMRRTQMAVNNAWRMMAAGSRQAGAGIAFVGRTTVGTANYFRTLQRQTEGLIRRFLSWRAVMLTIVAALGLRQVVRTADAYLTMGNRLRLVTDNQEQLNRAMDETYKIAQRVRLPFETINDLYFRIARSSDALRKDQDRLLKVVEAVGTAIQLSGVSAMAADAALVQFSQGLASGRIQGDELRSVLEQTPRLGIAIADGLGVGLGALRKLGEEGELTTERILGAIESQIPKLTEEFEKFDVTIGQAFTNLSNSAARALGLLGERSGLTNAIALFIQGLAKRVDDLVDSIDQRLIPALRTLMTVGSGEFVAEYVAARSRAAGPGGLSLAETQRAKQEAEELQQQARDELGAVLLDAIQLLGDTLWNIVKPAGSVISQAIVIGITEAAPFLQRALYAAYNVIADQIPGLSRIETDVDVLRAAASERRVRMMAGRANPLAGARIPGSRAMFGSRVNNEVPLTEDEFNALNEEVKQLETLIREMTDLEFALGRAAGRITRRVTEYATAPGGAFDDATTQIEDSYAWFRSRMEARARPLTSAAALVTPVETAVPTRTVLRRRGGGQPGRIEVPEDVTNSMELEARMARATGNNDVADRLERQIKLLKELNGVDIERAKIIRQVAETEEARAQLDERAEQAKETLASAIEQLNADEEERMKLVKEGKLPIQEAIAQSELQRRKVEDLRAALNATLDDIARRSPELQRIVDELKASMNELRGGDAEFEPPGQSSQFDGPGSLRTGFNEGLGQSMQRLNQYGQLGEAAGNRVAEAFSGVADSFVDAISGAEDFGDAFRQVAGNLLKDLAKLIIQFTIFRAISSSFGFSPGAGITPSTPVVPIGPGGLPVRAAGGPVRPGQAYVVGERGPEPFVPDVAGRIMDAVTAARAAYGGAGALAGTAHSPAGQAATGDSWRPVLVVDGPMGERMAKMLGPYIVRELNQHHRAQIGSRD